MAVIPTVELVGPAGRRIVNACDEQQWRAKGYKLIGEKAKTEKSLCDNDADGLFGMENRELRELAEACGIDLGGATKKSDLVAAIRKARTEKTDSDKGGEE